MIVKVDGVLNKELGSDRNRFCKFLKENTHSGKVDAHVELFKQAMFQRPQVAESGKSKNYSCNENKGIHWIMSTFDTDRDFERIDPSGWNLEKYIQNPVILWSHDYYIPAIGYAENVKAESVLEGDVFFNNRDYDEFGWSIGQRVKNGSLRCGSVGFAVEEVEFLNSEDKDCDLIYRKQELLEFSICCVPANPFARAGEKNVEILQDKKDMEMSFFGRICSGVARA